MKPLGASYSRGPVAVPSAASRLSKAAVALLLAFLFLLSTFGAAVAHADPTDKGFDPVTRFWCMFGDESLAAAVQRGVQTDDYEFKLRSKSSIAPAAEDVEVGPLGLNYLLSFTGHDFKKVNDAITGDLTHATEGTDTTGENPSPATSASSPPSASPTAGSTPSAGTSSAAVATNGGVAVNPFDRFGLAGLNFTGYQGEWKYVQVNPCATGAEPTVNDPKAALFYPGRLTPRSTFADVAGSKDIRSVQFANSQHSAYFIAFNNYVANFLFFFVKLLVALTIVLMDLSFTDLSSLIGLNNLIAGSSGHSGIFQLLYDGLYRPFLAIIMALTAIYMGYRGLLKSAYREVTGILYRSFAMLLAAAIIMANPLFWITLPNKLVVGGQAVLVSSMNKGLAGGDGLCATDIGQFKTTVTAGATKDDPVAFLDQVGKNMKSSVACSYWQQFLFTPWVEGQFGTSWKELWAAGKIPKWVTTKDHSAIANDEQNQKYVGDASVPLGGGKSLNNWALFQVSTGTTSHVPYGMAGHRSKYTAGIANDWWRVVDAFANYTETSTTVSGLNDDPTGSSSGTSTNGGSTSDSSAAVPDGALGDATKKMWPAGGPNILAGDYGGHSGIDVKVGMGTPVKAPMDGVVVRVKIMETSFGHHVVMKFADGNYAVFAHLSQIQVVAGQRLNMGDQIGNSGSTGRSTGPHLHYEMNSKDSFGQAVNRQRTLAWLNGAGASNSANSTSTTTTPQAPDANNLDSGPTSSTAVLANPNTKPLPEWDVWTGNTISNRIAVSFTANVVALVGLAAPLYFSALSAVYALGMTLLMTLLPFMLLMGCWVPTGFNIFKGWASLLLNTALKRLWTAGFMVMSIILSSACIRLMETQGWWTGMVFLMLFTIGLIIGRKKLLDSLAAVNLGGASMQGVASKSLGGLTKFSKGSTRLATMTALGGVSAKHHGGSFTSGAIAGGRQQLRQWQSHNYVLRMGLHAYDAQRRELGKSDVDSGLQNNLEENQCTTCEKRLGEFRQWAVDKDGNYYCYECYQFNFAPENAILQTIKTDVEVERSLLPPVKVKSEFTTEKLERDIVSWSQKDATTSVKAAVVEKSRYLARDIYIHRKHQQDVGNFRFEGVPDQLRPYLDSGALAKAWADSDYNQVRFLYAGAMALWVEQELGVLNKEKQAQFQNENLELKELIDAMVDSERALETYDVTGAMPQDEVQQDLITGYDVTRNRMLDQLKDLYMEREALESQELETTKDG